MTITLILVIVTCLISYQAFNDRNMKGRLLHYPYLEHHEKQYYRLLTSGFIHADWIHLIFNMYVLYEFGTIVETIFVSIFGDVMGRVNYLLLYLLGIVCSHVYSFFTHQDNRSYAALGASGAVSAVLFSFVIFQPWSMLLLFFVIPCPAILAAIGYLVYSSWASKNSNDNIGHDAHFYGAVFGFIFTIVLQPSLFNLFLQNLTNLPF